MVRAGTWRSRWPGCCGPYGALPTSVLRRTRRPAIRSLFALQRDLAGDFWLAHRAEAVEQLGVAEQLGVHHVEVDPFQAEGWVVKGLRSGDLADRGQQVHVVG